MHKWAVPMSEDCQAKGAAGAKAPEQWRAQGEAGEEGTRAGVRWAGPQHAGARGPWCTVSYTGPGAQTGAWAGCTQKSLARPKAGHWLAFRNLAGQVPCAEIKPSRHEERLTPMPKCWHNVVYAEHRLALQAAAVLDHASPWRCPRTSPNRTLGAESPRSALAANTSHLSQLGGGNA